MDNIQYTNEIPDIDSFYYLYESTGWNDNSKKPKEQLLLAIQNSWYFVSVYSESRLIGCGRIISDGYLHAFINEMIIDPEWQGRGVGKEILKRLVEKALSHGIKDIQLFCAQGKEAFYVKNGFVRRPDDAPGMQYRG